MKKIKRKSATCVVLWAVLNLKIVIACSVDVFWRSAVGNDGWHGGARTLLSDLLCPRRSAGVCNRFALFAFPLPRLPENSLQLKWMLVSEWRSIFFNTFLSRVKIDSIVDLRICSLVGCFSIGTNLRVSFSRRLYSMFMLLTRMRSRALFVFFRITSRNSFVGKWTPDDK